MSKRRDRRRNEQRRKDGGRHLPQGRFYVTNEPLDIGPKPPPEVANELSDLLEGVWNSPTKTLERLEALIAKYPDQPTLYNYKATALAQLGQSERYRQVVDENYRRHPDYLFARVNYAESLLEQEDPASLAPIPGIFGGDFDLRKMYPHRMVFHTSEFAGVSFVYGRYLILTGDLDGAQQRLELMEEIAPDHRGTAALRKLVLAASLQAGLKRFRLWRKKRKRHDSKDPPGRDDARTDTAGRT